MCRFLELLARAVCRFTSGVVGNWEVDFLLASHSGAMGITSHKSLTSNNESRLPRTTSGWQAVSSRSSW